MSLTRKAMFMKIALVLVLLTFTILLSAQEIEKKNYTAKRVTDLKLTIDGNLDEPEWQTANWEDHFTQYEPLEGRPPHQQTEFAILYDENNIYVGFKVLDTSPDSISLRLTRRDETDGDLVGILLDTYHDKRTSFAFVVSASGVKSDFIQSNDGENEDNTWDPIWWVKTIKNGIGWKAEMRIPLTQLRFEEGEEQIWGLQVLRFLFRKEEMSAWQPMKRDISGFVSQFGTMNGITNIKPKNTLDVMPYVVARTERFEKEPGNPFKSSGKRNGLDAGLDAKLGLTNYLTLDLTINPDFGQVEADPSEVNLSTYETFFEEKRPFFIEGKNILSYRLNWGDGDQSSEGLFYSRRIGRRPQYSPDLNDGEYAEIPDFTKILGAAKVSGKTKDGLSVGILESITGNEYADIKGIGEGREQLVEPLTNFFVTRIQKDFNDGNTYLGGMVTAVNRNLSESHLEYLHKSAYSGGVDFVHKWNNKNWMIDAGFFFSQVNGTAEAITATQKSYIRNFQRPDADYVELDTTRTSLMGQGGKLTIGKLGGKLKFAGILSWKSPGLEINDIGYAQEVDQVLEAFWMGYRFYEPFSIFRELNLNFNQYTLYDFGGTLITAGGNFNGHVQFKNYWSGYLSTNFSGNQIFNTALRGGPGLKVPGYKNLYTGFSTNQQKKFIFSLNVGEYFSNEKGFRRNSNYGIGLNYRPIKTLSLSVSPGISSYKDNLQYVTQLDYQNDKRYVFAHIDRKTLNMSLRINYNITPDLTIQYWGQPFIATGEYSDFKYITDSKANEVTDRYHLYTSNEISFNSDTYYVDDNNDGNVDYNFGKPDFNVKEFLSNLVLRWEYQPGSTVYLVWSQTRSGYDNIGSFDFSRDFDNLFDIEAHNIFLLKFSYRLGR